MDFNITALPADLIGGLAELKQDYNFSIDGKTVLTATFGKSSSITQTGEVFFISYTQKCEFYREFVKLLNGQTDFQEKRSFGDLCAMIDCSRNAVLNVPTVKELIRKLAVMGYNALMLYTEDTYEIKDEPYFGYLRGKYTQAEIKEIDAYASLFGIELIPCIQTLAHLNGITRWNEFKPIIDCNDILLAGDEKTYRLIDKMFATLSGCFSSRKVHIGMDEAHMVGLGKYLDKNGYENRFEILHKHLIKVLEIAEKYGFNCTMWSDMFFRLANNGKYEPTDTEIPESIKTLIPENVTLQYWDYYRNCEEEYDIMLSAHRKLSDKVSLACGAWRWNGFLPSNAMSINRNRLALSACKKYGIQNVTVTLWGDDGGECSTFAMLPSLVATAEFSYGNDDYEKAYKDIIGSSIEDFFALELAENPLNIDNPFFGGNFTKIFLYNDLLSGVYDYYAKPQYKNGYKNAAVKCHSAAKGNKKFKYLFSTAAALASLIAEKYDMGVRLRNAYRSGDKKELGVLADKITEIIKLLDKFYVAYKKQWSIENKPFGFEVQDIRLGGLKQRMANCRQIISDYVNGKIDNIPELETEIFKIEEYSDTTEFRCHDRWQQIVSVNRI